MAILATDAIVLHSFDYLESSRILRLVTRDGGVRSVLAKGARRSSRRFGSALDLFAQGNAQLYAKPGRDLDTLSGFDVVRSRPLLAADAGLFDVVVEALDTLAAASADEALTATLASAWRIVAELGFAPVLDICGQCHDRLADDAIVLFSHRSGGALCQRCGRIAASGRVLPAEARATIRRFLAGDSGEPLGDAATRAHQRLLREFLAEHLTDGRPLRALEMWEEQRW
jgi:DNA repair protein RecO (recombination protein O)